MSVKNTEILDLGSFNINNVIEAYKLDVDALAKALFTSVKYPRKALDRIIKGEAQIDAGQLVTLAEYAGVTVSDLFITDEWKGITEENCLTLVRGEYKVRLAYKGVFLTIYKNNEMIKQIIASYGTMTVYDFIEYLNKYIKSLENGNN